jgi:hypothetical protein
VTHRSLSHLLFDACVCVGKHTWAAQPVHGNLGGTSLGGVWCVLLVAHGTLHPLQGQLPDVGSPHQAVDMTRHQRNVTAGLIPVLLDLKP